MNSVHCTKCCRAMGSESHDLRSQSVDDLRRTDLPLKIRKTHTSLNFKIRFLLRHLSKLNCKQERGRGTSFHNRQEPRADGAERDLQHQK